MNDFQFQQGQLSNHKVPPDETKTYVKGAWNC